jgi:hypothetical protein
MAVTAAAATVIAVVGYIAAAAMPSAEGFVAAAPMVAATVVAGGN